MAYPLPHSYTHTHCPYWGIPLITIDNELCRYIEAARRGSNLVNSTTEWLAQRRNKHGRPLGGRGGWEGGSHDGCSLTFT